MNAVHGAGLGLALLLGGCFGNEVTEFPPGLDPLGENDLAGPGTEADPTPEAIELEATSGGRFDVLLGRGYIHAPIVEAWRALRDPVVSVDRRTTSEWSSEPVPDHPYDDSYLVHHVAHHIVTVEWTTTWRHGVVEGTADAPELIAIRWQKTDGSTAISVIEGSILLRPVGAGAVTEVELVYHVRTLGADRDTQLRYLNDVFTNAVALAHGDPLPPVD